MKSIISLIALTLVSARRTKDDNSVKIFNPLDTKSELEEKLLVIIPGADVATEFYTQPAQAIQEKTNLKLWVVVPAMPGKLCIPDCSNVHLCAPLQSNVQSAIKLAIEQGYKGTTAKPDVFMSGHSLGGVCAGTLVEAYRNSEKAYESLVVMGSYVENQDLSSYKDDVFTLGAELDGGLGRPGNLLRSMRSSDSWAKENGGIDGENQIR
jgi:hypothetical protein